MDLKKPLTFDEQLDKLIAHGMIVADREKAKDILKRVNYYRFTGYALQFRQEPSGSNYIEGTTFETVYHLYKSRWNIAWYISAIYRKGRSIL